MSESEEADALAAVERLMARRRSVSVEAYRVLRDASRSGPRLREREAALVAAEVERRRSRREARAASRRAAAEAPAYREERVRLSRAPDADELVRRSRCRSPEKVAYAATLVGEAAARLHVEGLRSDGFGLDLAVYSTCSCGWLHVGNDSRRFAERVRSTTRGRPGRRSR